MTGEEGLAALAEGFCPKCATQLRPLDDYEWAKTRHWASPPHAYCSTCDGVVGHYSIEDYAAGWYVSWGVHQDGVSPGWRGWINREKEKEKV